MRNKKVIELLLEGTGVTINRNEPYDNPTHHPSLSRAEF